MSAIDVDLLVRALTWVDREGHTLDANGQPLTGTPESRAVVARTYQRLEAALLDFAEQIRGQAPMGEPLVSIYRNPQGGWELRCKHGTSWSTTPELLLREVVKRCVGSGS